MGACSRRRRAARRSRNPSRVRAQTTVETGRRRASRVDCRDVVEIAVVAAGTTAAGELDSGARCAAPAISAAVPPVLHGIVRTAVEMPGNLRPLLAVPRYKLLDVAALLLGDGLVVERGLEVLMVALAALLGGACAKKLRKCAPN